MLTFKTLPLIMLFVKFVVLDNSIICYSDCQVDGVSFLWLVGCGFSDANCLSFLLAMFVHAV